jgi:CheY-like chemotaxis protein
MVLLDMHMPRCDGPTALRAIRSNPKTADLKVIAVSGSSPQEMGVAVSRQGVDGWFTKPLNPQLPVGRRPPVRRLPRLEQLGRVDTRVPVVV